MLRRGHIGLTMLVTAPIATLVGIIISKPLGVALLCGGLAGGNLPDIDTKTSIVKHRGFTHTLWFSILAGITLSIGIIFGIDLFINNPYISVPVETSFTIGIVFGTGMSIGVVAHILGDMITPRGIRPFDPVTPRKILPVEVSDKKYTHEIANADNPRLNSLFSIIGVIVLFGATYIFITI